MPIADKMALTPPDSEPIDDRLIMSTGICAFGLTIPWLTGLYGPLRPSDPSFWIGMVWFIALAAAIWLGNRWLLFKQREHFHWFDNPFRKLTMLVSANVLYTAPVSAVAIYLWFLASGQAVDRNSIEQVVLTNVICVLFVTHAYETVFLIRERASDITRVERLERMRSQAELMALKAQVDPHFLFNSLNTLGHLILREPLRGREFCDLLAEVYRYVLSSRDRDLVPLADELAFVRSYHRLLALRFGQSVELDIGAGLLDVRAPWVVPPLALQTLLENAVKHNQTGGNGPFRVQMDVLGDAVRVVNPLRPRSSALPSSGKGLQNLDERCRLLTGRALAVTRSNDTFSVDVPLLGAQVPP